MALEMTIKSNIGQDFESAYIRIDELNIDKNDFIYARTRAYINKDARESGANFIPGTEEIISIKGNFTDSAVNSKKQIYEYMKTLDRYKEAISILD